jgi:hypothetical protein
MIKHDAGLSTNTDKALCIVLLYGRCSESVAPLVGQPYVVYSS